MRTKMTQLLLLSAIGAGGALATAAPAQAAFGCGGTFLKSYKLAGPGTFDSWVDVYLENGRTNCLVNRTGGASYGQAQGMGIAVSKSASRLPSATPVAPVCRGLTNVTGRVADCRTNYTTFAGPVRINAAGQCISFTARTTFPAGPGAARKVTNVHCG